MNKNEEISHMLNDAAREHGYHLVKGQGSYSAYFNQETGDTVIIPEPEMLNQKTASMYLSKFNKQKNTQSQISVWMFVKRAFSLD